MELLLHRTYHKNGTNGNLYVNNELVCHTIELPWNNNNTGSSCIPEGSYHVTKRFSTRHQHHLYLPDVPGRHLILIHKANNAQLELRGCIAPVMQLLGAGKGYPSAPAFRKLYKLVSTAIGCGETVQLIIQKQL